MPARLLFDVTGLVAWYAFYRTPTGIQRVIERILLAPAIADDDRVVHVAGFPGLGDLVVIDRGAIHGLGDPRTNAASIRHLRRAYVEMMKNARLLESLRTLEPFAWRYFALTRLGLKPLQDAERWPPPDSAYVPPVPLGGADGRDAFVNLGDFWWYTRQSQALGRFKAQHGFKLVQMIHDLFPLGQSAWEPSLFKKKFIRQFAGLVPLVDRWMVNSEFVRGELRRHLGEAAGRQPIERITLGWPSPPAAADTAGILDRHGLQAGRYFLQVGTLEPRKNHIAVARAVERLRQRHGTMPATCVFAGVKGWRNRPLMGELASTQFAGGAIRWLGEVDDADLAALYQGALFTVYPSHTEGWGLPVQESLAFGVPCIASKAGAIPEAGRDLVVYVDPTDDAQVSDAIDRYLSDSGLLAAARARIAAFLTSQRLPNWNDAACLVLDAAERSLSASPL
jgi:glycosyltransferase involved in cell wall biosynthesis